MIKGLSIIWCALIVTFSACQHNSLENTINKNLEVAIKQYQDLEYTASLQTEEKRYPRSAEDKIRFTSTSAWTSGFFPGSLWYIYHMTNNPDLKQGALKYTLPIKQERTNTGTHDLGFMFMNSFGNALNYTNQPRHKSILLEAAHALKSRYNRNVGAIKSWDFGWDFPVIIDNMMNLELLFWAFEETNDSVFYEIAINHANTTMENHFREDGSVHHVVAFDTISGIATEKIGRNPDGKNMKWSRGQAWAVYGYAMCYRYTENDKYLQAARSAADFFINMLPEDFIPYHQLNEGPPLCNTRDASAGAILCSALIELHRHTGISRYKKIATDLFLTLSSDKYFAAPGTNNFFLIKHGTGNCILEKEVDAALIYADYYYLESMKRIKNNYLNE